MDRATFGAYLQQPFFRLKHHCVKRDKREKTLHTVATLVFQNFIPFVGGLAPSETAGADQLISYATRLVIREKYFSPVLPVGLMTDVLCVP